MNAASSSSEKTKTEVETCEQNPMPDTLYLKCEKDRFSTLSEWNNASTSITKSDIAKNGFYFTGYNTTIKCCFCNVEITSLANCESIADTHREISPDCPFILNKPTGNIPLEEIDFQINEEMIPYNPDYILEVTRLQSFECWPKQLKQTPAMLAQAGLYYTGSSDKTVCFQCGGGLKGWDPQDDPWQQHARWFPGCQFVRLSLGDDVVAEAKRNAEKIEVENLKSVNEDNSNVCIVCEREERKVCFVPCGHIITCVDCCQTMQICLSCNKQVENYVRVFYC